MPGIADKFTQSARGRPLWPAITKSDDLDNEIFNVPFASLLGKPH